MAALEVEVSIRGTELAIVDFQELLIGKHGENIPNIAGAAATLIEARKILGELGVKGKFYAKELGGKMYVVIKGAPGLRESLTGTRYLMSNPKIVALGIGGVPRALSMIRVGGVVIIAFVALETMKAIISDETDMAAYLGKVGPGLAKAAAATIIGHVAAGAFVAFVVAPVGVVLGAGIVFSLLAGWELNQVFDEDDEEAFGDKIRNYLADNEELNLLYFLGEPREGDYGNVSP